MKEFTLYDKIALVRNDLQNKPYSISLNLLLFSYLTLLKLYDELLDKTMLFTMSVFTPCTLAEDFRTLASVATRNINDAKIEIRYVNSIDPENPYSYLLNGLIKSMSEERPDEDFGQALIFLGQVEREELKKFLNIETNSEKLQLYTLPDVITDDIVNKMDMAIENNPDYAPLKVSFAEMLMKKENFELAKEKLTAILSQYPLYPRATALLAKIYKRMGKINEAKFTIRNLIATNPLSVYTKDLEEFVEEKEPAETSELKLLFETNNPIIAFFKETFKKIQSGEFKTNPQVEEAIKQKEPIFEETVSQKEVPAETHEEIETKEFKEEQIKETEKKEATAEENTIYKEETTHKEIKEELKQEEPEKETLETEIKEGSSKREENKEPQVEELPIDTAFELLYKKEYEKAIQKFLQALKEENINY